MALFIWAMTGSRASTWSACPTGAGCRDDTVFRRGQPPPSASFQPAPSERTVESMAWWESTAPSASPLTATVEASFDSLTTSAAALARQEYEQNRVPAQGN